MACAAAKHERAADERKRAAAHEADEDKRESEHEMAERECVADK